MSDGITRSNAMSAGITYEEFLRRVIEEGMAAARESYAADQNKLNAAIAGFWACRGKTPMALLQLLGEAQQATARARRHILTPSAFQDLGQYWRIRCYEAEVEWVCNCVSAMLVNQKLPPIIPPTVRGMRKAASILGVEGEDRVEPGASPTPEERQDRATEVVRRYWELTDRVGEKQIGVDPVDALVDLLTDLRHYARGLEQNTGQWVEGAL